MIKISIISLLVLLTLVGCGKKDKDESGSPVPSNDTSDSETVTTDADTEGLEMPEATVTASEPEIMPAIVPTEDELSRLDTAKIGYGCGNNVDSDNRSVGAQMMQDDYGKYNACFIGDADGCIYLTFDEGYENGYTSQILDTLKEKGVCATFFVTYDYAKKNPDLIQRMADEGHAIGNHSCSHPSMPTLSSAKMKEEITGLSDYISETFGYDMTVFRPPMGEFSELSLAVTESLGYKSVFWSFAYRDWETDNQPDTAQAYEKITSRSHSGAIYLLHAVSSTNTAILPDVIDYWQNNGYTVCAFK